MCSARVDLFIPSVGIYFGAAQDERGKGLDDEVFSFAKQAGQSLPRAGLIGREFLEPKVSAGRKFGGLSSGAAARRSGL